MGNIRTVLKEMFPDAGEYSDDQINAARRVMQASTSRTPRSMRLPSIYIPVGGEYVCFGKTYRCIARPKVVPRDCCLGCDLSRIKYPCPAALQCSKFDRADGRFVWFVEVSKDKSNEG